MKQILGLLAIILAVLLIFTAMWYVGNKIGPKTPVAAPAPPKPFHACSGAVCVDADTLQLNPQGSCAVLDGKTVMCGTFSVLTNK